MASTHATAHPVPHRSNYSFNASAKVKTASYQRASDSDQTQWLTAFMLHKVTAANAPASAP